MRRLVLAALAAAALVIQIPSAHAGDDSTYLGGCSFVSISDPVAGVDQQTGEIDVEALVYSPSAPGNPVWATFTCYIKVNGVVQPGATVTASGAVAVVGASPITYTSANVSDFVQLCQRVDYTGPGDTTPTSDSCFEQITFDFPPCTWGCGVDIDTVVCLVTPAVPDVPGLLDTNEQGDVYLAGEPFWDCPPYDVIWP